MARQRNRARKPERRKVPGNRAPRKSGGESVCASAPCQMGDFPDYNGLEPMAGVEHTPGAEDD